MNQFFAQKNNNGTTRVLATSLALKRLTGCIPIHTLLYFVEYVLESSGKHWKVLNYILKNTILRQPSIVPKLFIAQHFINNKIKNLSEHFWVTTHHLRDTAIQYGNSDPVIHQNLNKITSPKAPRPMTFRISKSSLCNRICFTLEVNGLAVKRERRSYY